MEDKATERGGNVLNRGRIWRLVRSYEGGRLDETNPERDGVKNGKAAGAGHCRISQRRDLPRKWKPDHERSNEMEDHPEEPLVSDDPRLY